MQAPLLPSGLATGVKRVKRIVGGFTYNTETSTRLARGRSADTDKSATLVETLYQTRGGAFFIVEKRTMVGWNQEEQESETRVQRTFVPVGSQRAQNWMLEGEVHVFQNPFDDAPEAVAEREPGATIYIRVPAILKRAVDAAAREQNVSGNVWAMRCIERFLEKSSIFDDNDAAPLVRKLLSVDANLTECLNKAREFWVSFFDKNSEMSVRALAKELSAKQRAFERIFEERPFAKQMMPLTCLGFLHDHQNKHLARKIVKAFECSGTMSSEIRRYLNSAAQVYPFD